MCLDIVLILPIGKFHYRISHHLLKAKELNALKIDYLDPKTLVPNPWNSNVVSAENEVKLDNSLKRVDMYKPIVVRTLKDGTLQILGGQHRSASAVRLKLSQVPVINLGFIDDKKAKEISLLDNGRYGRDDTLALAEILDSIGDLKELTEFMPFTDAEIGQIFSSVDIDFDDLDIEDPTEPTSLPKEAPGQTHVLMRFKVPIDDAAKLQGLVESVMKKQGFTKEDSLSNAGNALVWLMQKVVFE
jgi:ParB family transcriptional regulator, chromosome partitioning protein